MVSSYPYVAPSTGIKIKFPSDLLTFSIFSDDILLDLHNSIRVVPLKYSMYFLAGINTK